MAGANCWEQLGCGLEPGGVNVSELGVCPAAVDTRFDGEYGGTNGGRACWAVRDTLCTGQRMGQFSTKWEACKNCGFLKQVASEEDAPVSELMLLAY